MLNFSVNNTDIDGMKQQQQQNQQTQAPNIGAQQNVNAAIQRAASSSLWGGTTDVKN